MSMTFMNLLYSLTYKASDGDLTMVEVSECLSAYSPDHFKEIYEIVQEANSDGHISWSEVVKIASAVIL